MDEDDGTTNLMFAANWGYEARVTELLASGDDVEAVDCEGHHALHFAAAEGHLGCLQALLAANATIEATDMYGRTPLF
jgi:ankyrin repeat protein